VEVPTQKRTEKNPGQTARLTRLEVKKKEKKGEPLLKRGNHETDTETNRSDLLRQKETGSKPEKKEKKKRNFEEKPVQRG